jgi:Fe-S cluster assembly protein SufD
MTSLIDSNLLIDNNELFIINDYLGEEINCTVNSNVNGRVLFFAKNNSKCKFNITLKDNAYLKLDLILMNSDTVNDLYCDLVGEYSNLEINILSLAKECKKEINIYSNHLAPETKSTVSNYGISFENGKNNFNTIGTIKPNMKNSDVRQITKGLILSPSGECVANPILLIDYYDVKAYHGATIGKINDDDLFYLMSRGLTKEESFMLVVNGILEPFIKDISDENIKADIMNAYHAYF